MSEILTENEKEHLKQIKQIALQLLPRSIFKRTNLIPAKDVIIAGGWFAKLIRNEPARNIDIFILCGNDKYDNYRYSIKPHCFKTKLNLQENQKSYLPKEMCYEVFEDQIHKPKIRYIFSKASTRKELISSFDFLHCTISFDTSSDILYASPSAYYAAKNKVLLINEGNHPSIERMKKFANEEGYKYGHGCNVISTIDVERNFELDPGSDLIIPEGIDDG